MSWRPASRMKLKSILALAAAFCSAAVSAETVTYLDKTVSLVLPKGQCLVRFGGFNRSLQSRHP